MKLLFKLLLITSLALMASKTAVSQNLQNALNFDGGSNYVTSNLSASGLTSFTVEMYIKPAASQFGKGVFQWATNLNDGTPMVLLQQNGTTINGYVSGNYNLSGTISNESWNHIAITYNGTTYTMYVNGVSVSTFNGGISFQSNATKLFFGNGFNGFWSGSIDEARIWNTARTQTQISSNYNNELVGNESGLLAYYKFNEGVAGGSNSGITTTADATSNGNTGTLNGSFALTGNTSNWVSSLSFNTLNLLGITTRSIAAFSLRKLSSTYSGSAIQVRRSSDNTTQDIGFTAAGDLDTTALKTFVGSNNGFVTIWYDQSGNGSNAINSNAATQPSIVTSGVISRAGSLGKPFITTATTSQSLSFFTPIIVGSNLTANAVAFMQNPTSVSGRLVSLSNGENSDDWNNNKYVGAIIGNSSTSQVRADRDYFATNTSKATASLALNTPAIITSLFNGTNHQMFVNGSVGTTVASSGSFGITFGRLFENSNNAGSAGWAGGASEVVLYSSALSANDRQIIDNSQSSYYTADIATLSSLTTSFGVLSPAFNSNTLNYSGVSGINSVTITPTTTVSNASIQVRFNGGAYSPLISGNASSNLVLNVGVNTIDVLVTAQDGTTQKTYTISITRSPINDQVVTVSSGCNGSSVISLASSQTGIYYFLRNNATNAIIAGPTEGTGSAINFNTGTVTSTTTYNILAQSLTNSGALSFDGSDDNVFVNSSFPSVANFTFNAWVNLSNTDNLKIIGSNLFEFAIIGGKINLWSGFGSGFNQFGVTTIPLNAWVNVAITYDGTTVKYYVNGVLDASFTATFTLGAVSNLRIGSHINGGRNLTGTLDELRFWNVSKTQSEIQSGMYSSLTGTEPGLLAYYNFNEASGSSSLTDVSGNGRTGALENMNTSTAWVSGPIGSGPPSSSLQMINTPTVTITSITLNTLGLTASTPATSAYSLRKLSSNYNCSAIQVRRSSDNATQDIGFTAGGDLDTTTLKTFVGAGNGLVTIWYDQSGNARNLTQTNTSRQPSIVIAGNIYRRNNKPTVYLDGSDDGMLYSGADYLTTNPISVNLVAGSNSSSVSNRRAVQGTSNWLIGPIQNLHSWFAGGWNHQTSPGWSLVAAESFTIIQSATNPCTSWRNGIAVTSANNNGVPNKLSIGIEGGFNQPLDGFISELLSFNAELTTIERQSIETNQASYFPNNDATLASLTSTIGTLSPTFNSSVQKYVIVSTSTSSGTITPTASIQGATIEVRFNGGAYSTVSSGTASSTFSAVSLPDTIDVRVTAVDGITVNTYSVILALDAVNWTGDVNTDWNNAGNWSFNTLPSVTTGAIIPTGLTNYPVIGASTAVVAKNITIQAGASLTLNTGSSLTIDGFETSTNSSIYNLGTLHNNGTISIGSNTAVSTNGINNFNGAASIINNNATGIININRTTTNGINNYGSLNNSGKINIGAIASVGTNGIQNNSSASLVGNITNNVGGEINIDRSTSVGLLTGATGVSITNNGKINIGFLASVGGTGVRNNSGSTITNNSGAEINIDRSTSIGFNNLATVNNTGKITIGANASVGANGLVLQTAPSFSNNLGGEIKIDRATTTGLNIATGAFTNAGKITIGSVASNGTTGFIFNSTTAFNNTSTGEINIDRSTTTALTISRTFNNSGKITIGANASVGANGINHTSSASALTNNACGTIYVLAGNFNATNGAIINNGYIQINNTLGRTSGTFTNNAVLKYGTLTGTITNTNNAAVIVNNTPTPIFTYGGIYNGTINGIYTDTLATNLAGSFTTPNNFIANALPNGVQTLYAKLTPNASTCNYVIPFTFTPSYTNIWTGVTNNDWNTAGNWSLNTVPTTTDSVFIPSGTPNAPTNSGAVTIATLAVGTGASLTNISQINVTNILRNSGSISGTGQIVLSGITNQSIVGTGSLSNLTLNNAAGATIVGGMTSITGTYTPTAGVLTTGGNLTLKSNAINTATVAMGTGNYMVGNVIVERYFANKRAWRFVTAPTFNATTVFLSAGWQTQTHIVGPSGTGLDATKTSYSFFTYAPSAWTGVSNTNTTSQMLESNGSGAKAFAAYLTGNRNVDINNVLASSAVTLSSTGSLLTGTQNINIGNLNAGDYFFVANPYASPVDLNEVFLNGGTANINRTFYTWNPTLSGTGGYVTISWNGSSYDITPASAQTQHVQSGQAFFVQANATAATTITFEENDKSTTNINNVFGVGNGNIDRLNINLQRIDNGSLSTRDGVIASFGATFSKQVLMNEDADKLFNNEEGIIIKRGTRNLSIERRPFITNTNDTIFLALNRLVPNTNYTLNLNAQGWDAGMQAVLVDKFLSTETPINLQSNSQDISITSATANATDRFMIVFRGSGNLPNNKLSLVAAKRDKDVQLTWNIANEVGVKEYELQRSIDGTNFQAINNQVASNKGEYNFIDTKAIPLSFGAGVRGEAYYRVKMTMQNDDVRFSNIITLSLQHLTSNIISIYPNPVIGKTIGLQVQGLNKGDYDLRLINAVGQTIYNQKLKVLGSSMSMQITTNQLLAKGNYTLQLVSEQGASYNQQVLVVE